MSCAYLANFNSIRQVSRDQEPFDLSQDKFVEAFHRSMKKWGEKMSSDQGGYAYGFVDFDGVEPKPYGVAY